MTTPAAAGNILVFTLEEFTAELGFRSPRFVEHLMKRNAFDGEVNFVDGKYHVSEGNLADMKERNRKLKEEMHYAFENREEIRRNAIRQMVLESSGVDEETAIRLGL